MYPHKIKECLVWVSVGLYAKNQGSLVCVVWWGGEIRTYKLCRWSSAQLTSLPDRMMLRAPFGSTNESTEGTQNKTPCLSLLITRIIHQTSFPTWQLMQGNTHRHFLGLVIAVYFITIEIKFREGLVSPHPDVVITINTSVFVY